MSRPASSETGALPTGARWSCFAGTPAALLGQLGGERLAQWLAQALALRVGVSAAAAVGLAFGLGVALAFLHLRRFGVRGRRAIDWALASATVTTAVIACRDGALLGA